MEDCICGNRRDQNGVCVECNRCDDMDCFCNLSPVETDHTSVGTGNWTAGTSAPALDYVFIWRDVKPGGWMPKMIWARLLRRKLEVYTHPKRMTDQELVAAIMTAEGMGCLPEVYSRLDFEGVLEGTSDSSDTVPPTNARRSQ